MQEFLILISILQIKEEYSHTMLAIQVGYPMPNTPVKI